MESHYTTSLGVKPMTTHLTRRQFIASASAIATGIAGKPIFAQTDLQDSGGSSRRVGAVAYGFYYAIGLFRYKDRPGERMKALEFVEATRKCGGDVAQLYHSMITSLNKNELKELRNRAEELDVALEVHGGSALLPRFEEVFQSAVALGIKVVGCSFGMLMRPDKIESLEGWDAHTLRCQSRLAELARAAKPLGLTIGVENHLDFTVEELWDLVTKAKSNHVGVIFDIGNTVGTLDDPTEAAELLGPYVVATHYKDFAIEETNLGFRFTMVPLGSGSLRIQDITKTLLKHIRPDVNFSIEMMNGQHFDVNWLEKRFWTAYRNKAPRQVAATLRHIRSKPFDPIECIRVEEYDKLSYEDHVALELDRMKRCVAYLCDIIH